jgi:predicted ribonuclease YlaK
MTLILELPDNKEAALKAKAQAQGISAEQYVEQMLDHDLQEPAVTGTESLPSIAHLQKTDPEEWIRQFHAYAESHDRNTPLLSDEAISRDSIYPDRL